MVWILGVAHTLRLHHIDLLGEMPVEKGVINIKLGKAPLAMECNVEHSTNGDGIYHGTESLVKINIRLLVKVFSNKSSFIPNNRAIGILFDAKKPICCPLCFAPGLRERETKCKTQVNLNFSEKWQNGKLPL